MLVTGKKTCIHFIKIDKLAIKILMVCGYKNQTLCCITGNSPAYIHDLVDSLQNFFNSI